MAYRIGQDPGITSLIWLGQTNIHLGYLEQAEHFFAEAQARSEILDHPYTMAFTSLMAGITPNNYYRRHETAFFHTRTIVELANKEGFGFFN